MQCTVYDLSISSLSRVCLEPISSAPGPRAGARRARRSCSPPGWVRVGFGLDEGWVGVRVRVSGGRRGRRSGSPPRAATPASSAARHAAAHLYIHTYIHITYICAKHGGSDLGRHGGAPEAALLSQRQRMAQASGCPELQPAFADPPLGPRR